jgi:hypothetical protein
MYGLNDVSKKVSKYMIIQPKISLWATLVGLSLIILSFYLISRELENRTPIFEMHRKKNQKTKKEKPSQKSLLFIAQGFFSTTK